MSLKRKLSQLRDVLSSRHVSFRDADASDGSSRCQQPDMEPLEPRLLLSGMPLESSSAGAPAPFPLGDTFDLHSKSDADHTIYLDFNGHDTTDDARYWVRQYNGGSDFTTPAFDPDNDGSSFSNNELDIIQKTWQRVAEDFIPFNVDVTTEFPGRDAIDRPTVGGGDGQWGMRAVIGGDDTDWYADDPDVDPASGVAALGSFDWRREVPAWIFSESFSVAPNTVATTISHEVGHTFGLNHDRFDDNGDGDFDSSTDTTYYGGQGSGATAWTPIMGSNLTSNPLTHWDKGEFNGALNNQNDLNVITTGDGVDYRGDDHVGPFDDLSDPTPLSGTSFSASGIISKPTDQDAFRFDHGGGQMDIQVDPAPEGPNLDIQARLFEWTGASWNLVTTENPTGQLDAEITGHYPADTYMLEVDGVGEGNPATNGYSDYGSLGQFTVQGTVQRKHAVLPNEITGDPSNYIYFTADGVSDDLQAEHNAEVDPGGPDTKLRFAGNPGWNGTYDIDVGNFGNAVDPVIGLYGPDGDLLYSDDSSGPGNDAHLSESLNGGQPYTLLVRDQGQDDSGDISVIVDSNHSASPQNISFDGFGDARVDDLTLSDDPAETDYYKFTVPSASNGNMALRVTPPAPLGNSSWNPDLFFTDTSGNVIATSTSGGTGDSETLSVTGLNPGQTYHAIVTSHRYNSGGDYGMAVEFAAQDDRYEPNDSESEAEFLGAQDRFETGMTLTEMDEDFYSILAPTDGTVQVNVTYHTPNDWGDIWLLNDDSTAADGDLDTQSPSVSTTASKGDSFYIWMMAPNALGAFSYDLRIDMPKAYAPDQFEENDRFDIATDIEAKDQRHNNLSIDEGGDDDYYKWTAPAGGQLHTHAYFNTTDGLFNFENSDLDLQIYDGDEQLLAESQLTSDNESLTHSVTAGETYYLRVYSTGFANTYDLELNFPKPYTPDTFEENDAASTAADLGQGDHTSTGLTIDEPGDDDYYQWTAPVDGALTVDVLFDHDVGDMDLDLLDSTESVLDRSNSVSDNEQVTASVTAGDTYYIKAYGYSGAAHPDYDLRVQAPDDHGDDAGSATAVATDTTISGELEFAGNHDWFSFDAQQGHEYRFETVLNSLTDSTLRLIAQDGTSTLVFNDDADGLESRIDWTAPADGTYYIEVGAFADIYAGTYDLQTEHTAPPTSVAGRFVFYNNSAFDGNDAGANASDDNALAPGKAALLPGGSAERIHYTSYSRGLNGMFVDMVNPAAPGSIDADDFELKVGNDSSPGDWSTLSASLNVSVREDAGVSGSDRITLILPDGAVAGEWLQVKVLANSDTGLPADDVFYFGNAIGEGGDSVTDAVVNATDFVDTRDSQHGIFNPATITDAYDFNRDQLVNATDMVISRDHQTSPFTMLQLISAPASGGASGSEGSITMSSDTETTVAQATADVTQEEARTQPPARVNASQDETAQGNADAVQQWRLAAWHAQQDAATSIRSSTQLLADLADASRMRSVSLLDAPFDWRDDVHEDHRHRAAGVGA